MTIAASIIIANLFPIGNDESYYLAFAKNPQLSYVDAPPFVAYLNIIQMKFGLVQPLINRIGIIILHLISTIFLLLIIKNNSTDNYSPSSLEDKLLITFLISYLVPIFGFFSIFILPDSGLILGLSIMLWTADNALRKNLISLKDSVILGIGLGIGLLSKYHILPLGGGIILGLALDLGIKNKFLINVAKLSISIFIGLAVASPLFIWNFQNHFASFIFQLQHGFSSSKWQLNGFFSFILGSILYLTPWFFYILIKNGFKKKHYFLIIPVLSLLIILTISSLRKSTLPHWIAPGFWLLVPYSVINANNLKPLKIMCKVTAVIWVILLITLLLPGGIYNIKKVTKLLNKDTTPLADVLFWQEIPELFGQNERLQLSLKKLELANRNKCNFKQPLLGTTRWYWASQIEHQKRFSYDYKVLNLDLQSSNFYTWRDNLSNYANCPIVIISDSKSLSPDNNIKNIVNINNYYTIKGIGDYKSLNLTIIEGNLKDYSILKQTQASLLKKPKY